MTRRGSIQAIIFLGFCFKDEFTGKMCIRDRLLDCKVNLKLWVKVQKNWRDSDYMMKNFGYREDDMS